METSILFALLVALGTGLAIGLQTTLTVLGGKSVGLVQTGFLIHLAGALVGATVLVLIIAWQRSNLDSLALSRTTSAYILLAGAIGILILSGIGYAFPRTGQTAGQAAVIFGQMFVAILIDASGMINKEPIPLDLRRAAGLIVLVIAIYLLLPRQ